MSVKLSSSDGTVFEFPREWMMRVRVVRLESKQDDVHPCSNVSKPAMEVIAKWINEFKGTEVTPRDEQGRPVRRLISKNLADLFDAKQVAFVDNLLATQRGLFKSVILAANALEMEELLELLAARMGLAIKGVDRSRVLPIARNDFGIGAAKRRADDDQDPKSEKHQKITDVK